jgi:hypothetical protein
MGKHNGAASHASNNIMELQELPGGVFYIGFSTVHHYR